MITIKKYPFLKFPCSNIEKYYFKVYVFNPLSARKMTSFGP